MATETSMRWPEAARWYLEAWAAAFVEILQQIAAPDARAALVAEEAEMARALAEAENGFRARLGCSGTLAGRLRLDVSPEGLAALARILRGETSEADAPAEADRDAATQLLRQVAGQAAARLKAMAGGEIEFREEKEDGAEWNPGAGAAIRLEGGTPEAITVVLEIDEALAGALAARAETGAGAAAGAEAGAGGEDEGANLDLLLDVELEASIRFGQKELLLKDVLNLRPGAVVELARQVNEPAELLVAGRLMARGEVVVVEGNYGLRITEILGPAERIAAIRG
jgi:flagellar motor switch protein FliN/FliY